VSAEAIRTTPDFTYTAGSPGSIFEEDIFQNNSSKPGVHFKTFADAKTAETLKGGSYIVFVNPDPANLAETVQINLRPNWLLGGRLFPEETELQDKTIIENKVKELFCAAKDIFFEDGISNLFSEGLGGLVNSNGKIVAKVLDELIDHKNDAQSVISEALSVLGKEAKPECREDIFRLLEKYIFNPSVKIRFGALTGFYYLKSKNAVPVLKKALLTETNKFLKNDLKRIITKLDAVPA
jgi:hypothetical protein